jgi:hypothetical protein
MSIPTWQIDQGIAAMRLKQLSATLAVTRPDRGLHEVSVETRSFGEARFLGLALPSVAQGEATSSFDCYARGRDLIVAYPESPSWPVCADIIWRAISPAETRDVVAGVDVVISVRTALLDSWPELAVRSVLPSAEVLRLAEAETGQFEPCGVTPGSGCVFDVSTGPCLFVFRFPDLAFSYAEMTHPADFRGAALASPAENPTSVETRHRLFAERLEKGVILRGRVRGVVVDRTRDLQTAAACYAALATADPPLGT